MHKRYNQTILFKNVKHLFTLQKRYIKHDWCNKRHKLDIKDFYCIKSLLNGDCKFLIENKSHLIENENDWIP